MHSMGIIHRDLKCENILCVYPESIKHVKICDFGISTLENENRNENVGTLTYKAPEILKWQKYDKSVDYWSVGIIMYILLCGCPPFTGETDIEVSLIYIFLKPI